MQKMMGTVLWGRGRVISDFLASMVTTGLLATTSS